MCFIPHMGEDFYFDTRNPEQGWGQKIGFIEIALPQDMTKPSKSRRNQRDRISRVLD
jgi:hypothetical protein